VEDDDDNFRVAELRLGESVDLVRARNAQEACDVVRKRGSELNAILMDIELRGSDLNGVELVELLRGKPKRKAPSYAADLLPLRTPIIFVTAHGAKFSDALLMMSGGDHVIAKPVDFSELNLALTRLHLSRTLKKQT
jgi:CheY-like chemotaxis protein